MAISFDIKMRLVRDLADCLKEMGKNIREYPVKVINHRESKVRLLSDSLKMMKDIRRIKARVKQLEIR